MFGEGEGKRKRQHKLEQDKIVTKLAFEQKKMGE